MANLLLNEKRLNEEVNNLYSEEKNIEQDNPGYFSVIPANVRYDVELCPNAKLLYGEITALCNKEGYCWASNSYFARIYQVNARTVSRWINQLIKKGYIFSIIKYKEATKEIEKRFLSLSPLKDKIVSRRYGQNCQGGIDKIVQENNTSINNINKKERKKEDPPQLSFEKINLKNEKIKNEENIFDPKIFSKKETEKTFNVLIEEYSQNEDLRLALKQYLITRKRKRAVLNNYALKLCFENLDSLANNNEEKIKIVQYSIRGGYPLFYPLKEIQKKYSPVSQNTSYNIDDYVSTMDVFEPNKDEIRKKQKQVDPSFEKFKEEIKDDAIKRFGPRLGNKILQIKEREEFWKTVDTLKDMIKRRQLVWLNGDLVSAYEFEKMKEKENFENSVFPPKEPERESVLNYFL